jgi:hypothetical protein
LHNSGASRREIADFCLEHRFHEQAFAHHAAEARFALQHRIFPIIPVPDIQS